ncbi:conserved protein, unknown function [Plasmodium gallinaceum]|uniref:DUF1682 domain-containing protein n=1 Tax=Plasmodium gallinaceum TaxID=5849 RepID=A0A1J1GPP9_PLAGA|nr:conserved protein, unknown function [Plasmodium gallinaceum]CRG94270.1 conserved protein, unknown function [Plasmodium gallinaceum]
MRKFTTLFLIFTIYLSFYLICSNDIFDDIIIIEESDELNSSDIDPLKTSGDENIVDNTNNIKEIMFKWTGENEKLFYYKIILFICILIIAILNGIIGKKKNKFVALYWLRSCKDIFIENFAKIGNEKSFLLEKSYDNYEFFCTGRKNCNFYLVNLNLSKRQCIWRYYVLHYFIKQNDTMNIAINFEKLDKNILCIYKKNQKKQVENAFPILNKYTKFINKKELKEIYDVKGDSSEITDLVLSGRILNFINSHDKYINYICITDIPLYDYEEKTNDKKNENNKTEKHKYCYLNFIIPKNVEDLRKLINFSIYMIDACHCIELSEKVRDHVKKLRSIVEKEDIKRKQELKEIQEKKKAKKIQEEKEKIDKMSAEQQRKYEEKKKKKNLKKIKKIKVIKM